MLHFFREMLCNPYSNMIANGLILGKRLVPCLDDLTMVTIVTGIMRLRPHPESNDPWAMRSAWSAPVHLPQLFQELATSSPVFCHLKCSPVSGGLKPVWLNVGAVKNWGDCFANIQIQSPVIVRNFLPVPSDVELRCQKGIMLGLRGSIYPRYT